jgi:hypothetical protein
VHPPRGSDEPHTRGFVDFLAKGVDLRVAGANQLTINCLRGYDLIGVVDGAAARKTAFRERSVDPELVPRGDGEGCVS